VKTYLKIAASAVGVLIVAMPVTVLLTILLAPLWTWIEATYGIESIGHSGPADWCFEAVFAIVGGLSGLALWFGYWHRRI
jgi:hypothetical protein